ncbi:hypothetical protein [Lysinibacillus sp. BPa_S21]|uniref:hypothetical protein n=1 Tax=Lysinibacillus sp. BPa_S21 TaxID=2932478 RepID=UPI0027E32F49|nr:hypothetical protein [Lysinibacillus sp. BPa_S21]
MINSKTIPKITLTLMVIDIPPDVNPKSLKEILEKIFIIPIEIIEATIIKGIDNKIALIKFFGSFIGIQPLLISSTCKLGLLFGNLFSIFI